VACMPPAISIARMSRREAPRRSDSITRRLSPGPTRFSKLLWLLSFMVATDWAAANQRFLDEHAGWLFARAVPPHARRLHYLASEAHDAWDRLPEITAATLVIHGSDDEINVPANAPLLASRIPGAELHIIAGARHIYFWDHADEAHRVVRAFLARHPL